MPKTTTHRSRKLRPKKKKSATFLTCFRNVAIPVLRTYPSIKIWFLGCPSVDRLSGLVALIEGESLLKKTRIYVTDEDPAKLKETKSDLKSKLEVRASKTETTNKIAFFEHHLETDASLNEFQVIFCRDPISQTGETRRKRVQALLCESLSRYGFLVVAEGDCLDRMGMETSFMAVTGSGDYYRRCG
jgi:chemotaxis protein methyltransferase CheR